MTGYSISSAHLALRERTRELHAQLDNTLRLGTPGAGRAQYAQHVAAMWGWLQPLEEQLVREEWPQDLDASSRWRKVVWLEQDMDAARADGFLPDAPPVCAAAVDLSSLPARYGWAYVIEGSMLGGQVLLRRLNESLKPWPLRYLQGYGTAAGVQWRQFLATLAREVSTAKQIESASEAAAEAFTSIGGWLRCRGAA